MKLPTNQQSKRIVLALQETQRLIDKEERYSKDLQKKEYLVNLYAHMLRLNKMLTTGEGLPDTTFKTT